MKTGKLGGASLGYPDMLWVARDFTHGRLRLCSARIARTCGPKIRSHHNWQPSRLVCSL